MSAPSVSYRRHRFPRELIAHTVWLYFRFPLSFRSVEEMLLGRGLIVSCETIRRWSLRFGAAYARSLRRKTAKPGDVWHLDEARIVVGGQPHWLWRAVDQDGYVLDERRGFPGCAEPGARMIVAHTGLPCAPDDVG
ncbi:IS6 family transposase [Acidomonas methanolica]|nr:IS6 family transposase [Acidomonas methanolica]